MLRNIHALGRVLREVLMKIRVAVIFGGKSTEHEISIISAIQAIHAMDPERYEVIPVYMTKENDCYTGEGVGEIESYQQDLKNLYAKAVHVDWTKDGDRVFLMRHDRKRFGDNMVTQVDIAFPIVHGTNMEDGTLTGFLATLGLPVVGCDVLSSAVGMDKYVMKTVLKDNNIPVLDCVLLTAKDNAEPEKMYEKIEEKIAYPVIVKPVNLGSSVGITKASDREKLTDALELAFTFSGKVLVERAVTNLKEVNCAVLGDYEEARASECESPVAHDDILSFQDKYMSGGGKNVGAGYKNAGAKSAATGTGKLSAPLAVGAGGSKSAACAGMKNGGSKGAGMASLSRKLPADITDEKRTEIREMAVKAFQTLGCAGVTRIDFMMDLDDGGKVYLNEVNTVPGSLSFYLWEPLGLSYTELLNEMIELALKAQREKNRMVYSFDTNVLAGVRV